VLLSRNQAHPSLFTAAVVRGLRDGTADLDGDGRISVGELYDYVLTDVRQKAPGQTPTMSVDNVQGTIYIARGMPSPDTEILAELRSAAAHPQIWRRIGALHLVERALASVRESVRNAGEKALADLVNDDDRQVAGQARDLWHQRSLGPIPAAKTAHTRRVDTEFIAGIDFGTTNSAIGIFENGDVRMIPNAQGELITPSIVAFTADGQALVGAPAQRHASRNPEHAVTSVKLKLGSNWSIEHDRRCYHAEDVAALILAQLRVDAEAYTGGHLGGAVITVPAYFSHAQRYALRQAAEMAEINLLRITNEPTAASMTYGLNRVKDHRVLVVDLGGGTFDVDLVYVGEGVVDIEAMSGDNHLGGDDWDEALTGHLANLIQSEHGIDVRTDSEAMQRLRQAAEMAKRELSSALTTHILVPYLKHTPKGPVHVDTMLTRAEFETLTRDLLARCKRPIMRVLADAEEMEAQSERRTARAPEETLSRIDEVLLVGGSTRMPAIGELLRGITGKRPYRGLINEGIATGAALLAGALTAKQDEVLLIDAIPISLGFETVNGEYLKILDRNTTIPTKRSEIFTTTRDNQDSMTIHLAEGELKAAHENSSLAIIEITGLAPGPKGTLQIEIAFDIDANGVLQVSAKDLDSGRMMQHVTVTRDTIAEALGQLQSDRWPIMVQNVPVPIA
jgi:molecular chaperone DnaK